MAGVVIMNYHGYLILRGGERGGSGLADLFDPWTGPFSTRFAATFVLVAGVGVALMSATALEERRAGNAEPLHTVRWRLVSRGVVLYLFGLGFDVIWSGSILPYYGALFALAGAFITWRARWLVFTGLVAAVGAWVLRGWRFEREAEGHSTAWLTDAGPRSIRGPVFDLFVNGTHPLLPWLAFFCAGIVVGRVMVDPRAAAWWREATIGMGLVMFAVATLGHGVLAPGSATSLDARRDQLRWSLDPFDRGILYTVGAIGTALIAFAGICWLADRFERTTAIRVAGEVGRASLSIYVIHALVFNLVVDWLGWVRPAGVTTALAFAIVVWISASAAAVVWQRRHGQGPFEYAYRRITV